MLNVLFHHQRMESLYIIPRWNLPVKQNTAKPGPLSDFTVQGGEAPVGLGRMQAKLKSS